MYAEIILKNSLFGTFTYKLPERFSSLVHEGFAVLVPLRNSVQVGIVKRICEVNNSGLSDDKLKPIIDIFPLNPIFDKKVFELLNWTADYYIEPAGNMFFAAIPSGIFKLSNYNLVFRKTNRITNNSLISLSSRESLRKKYGLSLSDIFELVRNDEAYLEVSRVDLSRDSYVVLNEKGEDCVSKKELVKIFEKHPVLESLFKDLKERKKIPLYDVLTVIRDKRLLRYLYKAKLISIQSLDSASESYNIQESPVINLTEEQKKAIENIEKMMMKGFGVHYVYGVTGSGKTEIYLRLAAKVLRENKTVLFLVPEIALTPQSIFRIRVTLGCEVAVLHSGLQEKERIKEFISIRNNYVKVVVGARSAVFAPLSNIGLIIVDEEHDSAYKQEESPRYNGRDIAIKRGQIENCVVILGSATPSVQSIYNIRIGRFEHSRLTVRANKKPMPEIEIVSLAGRDKDREDVEGLPIFISERLYKALLNTVQNNNKAILMLNRRGYNTILLCSKCGYLFKCPYCDVNLTYHKKQNILMCHYCSFSKNKEEICPICGSVSINNFGFGTEQVEEAVKRIIPNSRTVRLDRDSVSNLYELESVISRFSRGDANILIGTQMVAKGHHFPDVTLVGVILADTAFSIPDFRVQERLMQLLMQVSGRAGRGEEKGEVIIQTFNPYDPSILAVKEGDPDKFLNVELTRRKNLFYPPFSKIILIRSRSTNELRCEEVLKIFKNALISLKKSEILGPVPSFVKKIKNEFRYQLMIKTTEISNVRKILKNLIPEVYKVHHNVRVNIDVDPLNML